MTLSTEKIGKKKTMNIRAHLKKKNYIDQSPVKLTGKKCSNDQFEKQNGSYHYIPHKHSKESKVLVHTTLCTQCWQLWWNGPIPQKLQSIKTLQGGTEKWPELWKGQIFQTDKAEANKPIYCAYWRYCAHEVFKMNKTFPNQGTKLFSTELERKA